MGPPSFMRSVINQNIMMRCVPVHIIYTKVVDYRYKWTQKVISINSIHTPKLMNML